MTSRYFVAVCFSCSNLKIPEASMQKMLISDKTRALELAAVLLTAAGKFLFMDLLHWRLPFIVAAVVLWSGYIIVQSSQKPAVLQYWGFRKDNFWQVVRLILPFALIAFVSSVIIGFFQGTLNLSWHILPLLLLYPVWGIIHQFLLIALTAGNLQDLKRPKLPTIAIILLAALLFGLIHYPFAWLMAGTFILALFYGFVYLKQRNIYVLGIFHGWLAALFYYTVVGRDPFIETFGLILNRMH